MQAIWPPLGEKAAPEFWKLDDAAASTRAKIDQVNVRVAALIAGIGQLAAVGSESRGDAYRIIMRQLTHIGSVIVGRIDFFASTPGGDEGDAGAGDSFVAGEGLDDVIGKSMCRQAWTTRDDFLQDNAARVDLSPAPEEPPADDPLMT